MHPAHHCLQGGALLCSQPTPPLVVILSVVLQVLSLDVSPEELIITKLSFLLHLEGKTARDADGHCHVFLLKNNVQDSVTGEWSKVCACGLKEPVETL